MSWSENAGAIAYLVFILLIVGLLYRFRSFAPRDREERRHAALNFGCALFVVAILGLAYLATIVGLSQWPPGDGWP